MEKIRIGTGAGYGGDRIDPAIQLIRKGRLDYIVFECLAERTIAIAHKQMKEHPERGFNELLEERMRRILPELGEHKVRIITNMGAANPIGAAKAVVSIAEKLGISGLKIAAVTGDDMLSRIEEYMEHEILETGKPLSSIRSKIMSANAYIGTSGIIEALQNGADIILCGRVSDPSLFLAPLMYEFGWTQDNYSMKGKGILAGHLLECGAQVMGGYYADPGYKDVEDLWNIGFPIGEVDEYGNVEISKLDDAAGLITSASCSEQILYEIHDPANYLTPDGIADFSNVTVKEIAENKVLVSGADGRKGSGLLKVSVGYEDCFIGEGEISYGGAGCLERAKLAGDIVKKRLDFLNIPLDEIRIDYIGYTSLYGEELGEKLSRGNDNPNEVRMRFAARTFEREHAEKVGLEVESLYLNGPAGGGGVRFDVKRVFSVASIFVPEEHTDIKVTYMEI